MFYATLDSEGGEIAENAAIFKFKTYDEARNYLLSQYSQQDADWDYGTAEIVGGRFGDCWIKAHKPPSVGEVWIKPFSRNQIRVMRPGTHPGGNVYWIEPAPEILVLTSIEDRT